MEKKKVQKMTGLMSLVFLLFLGVGLTVNSQAASTDIPEMNLKLATIMPSRGPLADNYNYLAKELERRTGGKIKIKIYWAQTLLKAPDLVDGVSKGVAEIGGTAANFNPQMAHWNALDLPGNASDPYAAVMASARMYREDPRLKKELADRNLVGTIGYYSGKGTLQSRMPFVTLKDMKGKRIRTYGALTASVQKAMGMVPVPMSARELYEALDKGVVDASGIGWQWLSNLKLWESVKHVTDTPKEGETCGMSATLLINKETWDGFPQSVRDTINEINTEINERFAKTLITFIEKSKKEFVEKHGGTIHILDKEPADIMVKAAKQAREEWLSKWEVKGQDVKSTHLNFMFMKNAYEREIKEKGYPWEN